jgi:hypothetical protein
VGESSSQVRAAYTGAWGEVIRDEDRPTVRAISLQRWAGQFWSGQWEHQMYLAVPTARGGKASPSEASESVEDAVEDVVEDAAEVEIEDEADVDPDAEAAPASPGKTKKK